MHKKFEAKDIVYMLHALSLPAGAEAPAVLAVPYADMPYDRDGIKGLNRLNKEIALNLVATFAELLACDKRFEAGFPFYVGHPDYLGPHKEASVDFIRNQPAAAGWIKSTEAGDDDLLLHVAWNPRGKKLIEEKEYIFFSPNLPSTLSGQENGVNIYIPLYLKSAGLTNTPNWSVAPMVHSGNGEPGESKESKSMKTLLERIQAQPGCEKILTEDDAANSCKASVDAVHAATQIKTKLDSLRKSFAEEIVHAAVERGSILVAHKESRVEDLLHAADESFLAKVGEIKGLPKLMKTETVVHTETAATRTETVTAAVTDPTAEGVAMVHARMEKDGLPFRTAFGLVAGERPELFGVSAAAKG